MKSIMICVCSFIVLLILVAFPGSCFADADKIFKENHKAVVTIYTYDKYGSELGLGSGFLVKDNGLIVTNYHVIDSSKIIKVKIGKKRYISKPVYLSRKADIAILKTSKRTGRFPVVKIGDTSTINIGDKVYVIGSPAGLENSISDGIISSLRNFKGKGEKYIQFTAPISPGSSGAPVFNKDGEVIGIATASVEAGDFYNEAQNLNIAIPIDRIKQKITGMEKSKKDTKAMLNHFFNNKGMLYFTSGIIMLIVIYKLNIFRIWLDFLNTLQHELVHIIVAGLFGGAPVSMEVNTQGGAAYTTKSNFIVRLSPYCLPLFCLLILGISFILDVEYKPVAFVMAGLFYGNFVRNAVASLHIQPDIKKSGGRLIAYPFICVFNIGILATIALIVKAA
jgi:V8-like Glu-specific endopeptidase